MKKQNKDSAYTSDALDWLLILLVFGFFFILLFRYTDWGFLKSEITAYRAECNHKVSLAGICNNLGIHTDKETYRINRGRQEVISKGFFPIRYTNCAIDNRKNWRCEASVTPAAQGVEPTSEDGLWQWNGVDWIPTQEHLQLMAIRDFQTTGGKNISKISKLQGFLKPEGQEYDDMYGTFGFRDGKFFNHVNISTAPDWYADFYERSYYLSKWEWLKLQCRGEKAVWCIPLVIVVN